MANNKIVLKKSSVADRIPQPTDIDYGELAINYADGKLYFKTAANTVDFFQAGELTVGPTGPAGEQGLSGEQGIQGDPGPQGLQGPTGPQGIQGPTGAQGTQGLQGVQGVQGPQGSVGPTGPQGPAGLDSTVIGPTGPTGPINSFSVYSGIKVDSFTADGSSTSFTLTYQPVSKEYVLVVVQGVTQPRSAYTVVGTTLTFSEAPVSGAVVEATTFTALENIVISYNDLTDKPATTTGPTGPTGSTGDTGDTGIQGPTGPAGPTIYPSPGIPVSTGTSWGTSLTLPSGNLVGTSGAQSLSEKTLVNPAISGAIKEEVGTAYTSALDPANGSIQKFDLLQSTVFSDGFSSGESILLHLATGGFSATWPNVYWLNSTTPTLPGTGYAIIALWKTGAILNGAYLGDIIT